jgi:membrane dipeptidase
LSERFGGYGLGFCEGAVSGNTPSAIAEAIRYGVKILSNDAISQGSSFDGNIATTFDASELILTTQKLLDLGFPQKQIEKVVGLNTLQFLRNQPPPN